MRRNSIPPDLSPVQLARLGRLGPGRSATWARTWSITHSGRSTWASTTVETLSTPFNGATYPSATTTYYEFPKRGNLPPVKLTWYDGGLLPPKPEDIGDARMNPGGGLMYVGTKGKLIQDTYGASPKLYPSPHPASKNPPPQKLKRIAHEEHEMNWVEAIKGQAEISSPFDYAAPLTEVMLLGIVALRAGQKIHTTART